MDKKSKLIEFAKKVISDSNHAEEVNYLTDKLNLTKDDVARAYLDWDLEPDSYGNDIYTSIPLRFAMYLHYLLKGSWHEIRQEEIVKILNKYHNILVIDIGFGAPQRYVKEALLNKKWKITLAEFDDSAVVFSEVLLSYWNPSWREVVNLKKYNMNSGEYVGDFDIYMLQDSIEHADDPTGYLHKLVQESPQHSKFIFSLPIEGDKVATGSHHIVLNNEANAEQWLQDCGLKITYSRPIHINPKVDLFSEGLNYHECIYECEKL